MNQTQILISVLFWAGLYLYCLLTGAGLLEILKLRYTKTEALLMGLMILFAITEVVSLPFMLLKAPYLYLLDLLLIITLFGLISSIHYLFFTKKRFDLLRPDLSGFGHFLPVCVLILIIIQTAVPVFFSRFDGDDAFYIAISTSIQTTGRIFINNPSIGLDEFVFPPNYRFTAYEILITVFSTITTLDPVVIYHSLLPAVFIPFYYMANYQLARTLFPGGGSKSSKYQFGFLLLICLFTLFDGYSNYLSSSFVLLKAWMGKTSTINICYIVFLIYFIRAYQTEEKPVNQMGLWTPNSPYFLLITITLIAGACTSAIGLYMIPVGYFVLAIASLFTLIPKIGESDWFNVRINFGLKCFFSALPSALLLLGFFVSLKLSGGGLEQLNSFESHRSWIEDGLLLYRGSLISLFLYIIASVYFGLFGTKVESTVFFVGPIVLLFTFLNPFLQPYVGHYLTSMPLYWRFFWLLPIFPTLAAFLIRVLKEYSTYKWKWLVLIPLLFILVPGNFALNESKYYASENSAKIPNDISTTVSIIEDNVNTTDPNDLYLLSLPHYNIYLRQYTGRIALVMPRLNFVREAYQLAGKENEFEVLEKLFTFDQNDSINGLVKRFKLDDLDLLNITLVITPEPHDELLEAFQEIELNNGDHLYIHNSIFKR